MELLLQQLLNALVVGSVYSLVALGLTLIYGTLEIPNFAHGHLYMLGAYITFFVMTTVGLHYWWGALAAILLLFAIGVAVERVVFHPLRHAPPTNAMIAAVGLMLFLEALAQVAWGADYRRLVSPYDSVVSLGGLSVTAHKLVLIAGAGVLILGLFLFLKKTVTGTAIEALAQNREGAMLVGINVNRLAMVSFGLSAALAAAAAALVAPINLIYPAMGLAVVLKAFVIVVIGGMGSIPGAVICGFGLAIAEALAGTYVAADYQDLIAFVLLAAVLTVKPSGLFGEQHA